MILYKLLAILFSILLLLQSYVIRKTTGSYLVPASLLSFAWFLFTFIPLILLFEVPINPLSILYIFLAIFVFSLSAIPFNWRFAISQNQNKKLITFPLLDSRFIRSIFYFSIIFSIIFSSLFVISNGFDINSFRSDFINTSARYAALRGNEYLQYGLLGTLSIFFTYFSAILGGIITYYKNSSFKKLLSFLTSVAPSLFAMLIQSSKLIFFVAIIFYLSSSLLIRIYSGQHFLFRFSDFRKVFWISILLFPLIILSFISREGYGNFNNTGEAISLLLPAVNSYLFGSMYAFSDFFTFYIGMKSGSHYNVEYYNLGYYSFKAIFDTFGGTKIFPAGFYSDVYSYKDILATNIYTVFRGFIQDFGILGTIAFMYLFGLLFHFSFYKLLVRTNSWLASSLFVMFFGFLGLSFLINIFTARYVFLLTLSLYSVLTINSYIYGKLH